jgi:hypothetical protein
LIEPSCARAAKAYVFEISSNEYAFAALKADGSIVTWGRSSTGGKKTPNGKDYIKIYSNTNAFAALKADGYLNKS